MKQQFAWAIVGPRDSLSIFSGQCPIYWHRKVAKRELANRHAYVSDFRIVKVTVLEVHKSR